MKLRWNEDFSVHVCIVSFASLLYERIKKRVDPPSSHVLYDVIIELRIRYFNRYTLLDLRFAFSKVQAAANSTAAKHPILSARIVHGLGKHSFAYHVCAKSRSVSVRSLDAPVSSTAGLSLFHQVVEADVNTSFGARDGEVDVFQVLCRTDDSNIVLIVIIIKPSCQKDRFWVSAA